MIFGKKKPKFLQMLLSLVITAIVAGVIFTIAQKVLGLVDGGLLGILVSGIGALVLFTWALKINPGKRETIYDIIPVLIVSYMLTEIFALYGYTAATVTMNAVNFAVMIASVYLAKVTVKKYLKI